MNFFFFKKSKFKIFFFKIFYYFENITNAVILLVFFQFTFEKFFLFLKNCLLLFFFENIFSIIFVFFIICFYKIYKSKMIYSDWNLFVYESHNVFFSTMDINRKEKILNKYVFVLDLFKIKKYKRFFWKKNDIIIYFIWIQNQYKKVTRIENCYQKKWIILIKLRLTFFTFVLSCCCFFIGMFFFYICIWVDKQFFVWQEYIDVMIL